MQSARVIIFVLLGVVLGVPFALSLSRDTSSVAADAPTLIVVTPHVQQIRDEFGRAFSQWHERHHGEPVRIDWRTPGGTSEIRKQLEANFKSIVKNLGQTSSWDVDEHGHLWLAPGSVGFDIMLGGGSYDHTLLKNGFEWHISETRADEQAPVQIDADVTVSLSAPGRFEQSTLDAWYGENRIGPQTLYDPDQFWYGAALSSFGIVFNRNVFEKLGLDEPDTFDDLTDPRLAGWIALADPRQSGSITTTFDSILGNAGWTDGWRTLRAMCGNTRYFTSQSTKPPIDVSQGEAAAGLAIDFYGRGQAQTVGAGRVGYTDPAGAVYNDADPVSILNGAPHPELARRFVEFCMSIEGQALWQLPPLDTSEGADNPMLESGVRIGPAHNALRRMPARRVMYERYSEHFVDHIDPFEVVSDVENPGWRTGVQVMMGCFAVDIAPDCRAAWSAIARARLDESFPPDVLTEMERLFFAWPDTPVDENGAFTAGQPHDRLPWTESNYRAIRASWRPPGAQARAEIFYTSFFRENYRRIVKLERARQPLAGATP
ncbi:MAG: ABC transporter substrate-binding protein [Phycisphaerales bacterium JB059]